jgi:hypothetical protein
LGGSFAPDLKIGANIKCPFRTFSNELPSFFLSGWI